MKNIIFIFLTLSTQLFSQSFPCGSIIERVELPVQHSSVAPLPPDPCDALNSYGTEKKLTVSVQPEYLEIKKRIRVVVETLINPDDCSSEAREVSRDTIEISRQKIYVASTEPVGGYWTVRMELMTYAPSSRPEGCHATKLPQGAMSQQYKDGSTIELKEYWVIHNGHYQSKEEAREATKKLKQQHPEFCRAYTYYLPKGCEYRYTYVSNPN